MPGIAAGLPSDPSLDALPAGAANTALAAAESALAAAYDALDRGDMAEAAASLRLALDLDPAFPEANGALAELLGLDGRFADAATHYARALDGDPGRILWHRNLAASLEAAGREDAALDACRALLDRRPDDAATRRRAARLLLRRGEVAAALEHAHEARFADTGDLTGLIELAGIFLTAGEPLTVAEMLTPVTRRTDPGHPELPAVLTALGRAWLDLSEPAKARAVLEKALSLDDGDRAGAAPLLARLAAEQGADLSPAFVRALFDRYADRFDQDLVGKLKYDAPRTIRSALERLGLDSGLDVLDGGCGTGLAGVELRPFARHLAGVDLAPRMVEKARARGIYDDLSATDLLTAFAATPSAWDLIVAADVLVYLGDLRPVLSGAAAALRPGGRMAFTVERGTGDGWHLHEGRRYAHGEDHVRAAAAAAGLEVTLLEDTVPRWDRGQPVAGMVVVLTRPA